MFAAAARFRGQNIVQGHSFILNVRGIFGASPHFSNTTGQSGPTKHKQWQPPANWKVTRPKPKYANMATLQTLNFDNLALRVLPIDAETENFVRQVRDACFSRISPTPVKNPEVVAYSELAMKLLDLDRSQLERKELAEYFSGNEILPGAEPAAHCYCGHQFGNFAGQLGDGATMYLGEIVNRAGERWEIQFKGAGLTPYSRSADGRKVMRSSIREFLCSEAIHHLGIPTTRAGTCVTSDTKVIRDIFYDGRPVHEKATIILRIAQSFIRFGSFEICKPMDPTTGRQGPSAGRTNILAILLDYVIKTFYPEIWASHHENKETLYLTFYEEIIRRTARLVADWQCVGWCHGVLNTDNMSIVGLTIDYGPYGFMDRFDPGFICNSSDDGGRYSYEKQPEMCHWNLMKLGEALHPVISKEKLHPLLPKYWEEYDEYYLAKMRKKLGLCKPLQEDRALVQSFFDAMEETGADFTNCFRALSRLPLPGLIDHKERKAEVLTYLLEQCSTLDEQKKSCKPQMDPRQLQMFRMLMQMQPDLIEQLGSGKAAVDREMTRMERAKQLEEMTQAKKTSADRDRWSIWLEKYTARLKLEQDSNPDLETLNQERVTLMNSTNPKFILRNYIAQNAISAAEEGDFSEVRRVLKLLHSPFSEDPDLRILSSFSVQNTTSRDEGASCSTGTGHADKAYACKPPMWAMDLQVT